MDFKRGAIGKTLPKLGCKTGSHLGQAVPT